MRVYQAIYGEDSTHGHGLLAHSPLSPGEQVPFAEATRRTDLPNTPPGGTNWTPYLRGFSEADYFVLTRTFPDEGASRRGMVITHALFLPLNEFCAVGKLSSAIALLQGDLKSGWKTHDTNLQVLDLSEVAPKTPGSRLGRMVDSNRYHALIHALVEEGVRLPVVWIGQAQFDEALSTLWEFLSPELRRTFTFRISFSPRDVEEAPPLLVCTPESLASHWPPPYKALGISMESLTITSPMAYLMGGESSHALRELQENLNIIVDGFSALRDLARIYTNIEEFRATNKLEPLDASLRLVAERVPLPTHGANMKSRLLMALTDRVPEAGRSEIRALRNFPAEAFPDGRRIIQSALIDWGRDVIFKHRLPTVDVVGVITEALKGNSLWATALQEGVRDALRQIDVHAATALWQWWKADSAMVSQLTSFVPNTPGSEATLVKTCPDSMSASTGGAIAHLARNRNWLRLHAATVAAYLPFRQALEAHLQVDKDPKIVDMVRSLCSKVSGQEVVAAALSLDDSRLIGIAGERIAQDNSLKKSIDVVDVRWRDIWLASIEAGAPPFEGVADPTAVCWSIFDIMIAGDEVTPVLLRRLIRSGYLALDLCDFPARTRLWPLLPDDVCTEILAATASGWLRRFTDNPNTSVTFEPEMILREAILQGPIAEAWRRQTNISASTMVAFLQRFPDYSDGEEMLTDWVGKHHRPNPLDAAAIGGFIRERRWRKAASEVASQSQNGHEDWDIATEECSELMGVLQKVLRAFRKQKSIMAADWWAAWLDVTADLYSTGVRDQNIWTRAAGDLSRIDVNRDGYTQWNDALSLLRRGGGGKITIEGLLHQMRKDWENHKHLEVIEKAWLKKRVKTDGA